MHDLAMEFCKQGMQVTILTPYSGQLTNLDIDLHKGLNVLRLKTFRTKDIGYFRRTIAEFLMPYLMFYQFKKTPTFRNEFDGIVWYSPTIFFGPLIRDLKKQFNCKSYLILRDLFPDWALDLGLMKKGPAYFALKHVEYFQYHSADVIGVQAPGNLSYLKKCSNLKAHLEVLWTWIRPSTESFCTINLKNTVLSGRKIFVYAGNMGVAQGMDVLVELVEKLKPHQDLGFVFVGRGSESVRLKTIADHRGLDNVLFFDEIDSREISGLYSQCDFGLIALDPRHKTHNIPGKFLSYMQSGLPVLAIVNKGNNLVDLIREERVGKVIDNDSVDSLAKFALELVEEAKTDNNLKERCRLFADRLFAPKVAVKTIMDALRK
jgi:glycosyltransferase involved in cell wall biosynthesis